MINQVKDENTDLFYLKINLAKNPIINLFNLILILIWNSKAYHTLTIPKLSDFCHQMWIQICCCYRRM